MAPAQPRRAFHGVAGPAQRGATLDAANAELAALTNRLGREFKATNSDWSARAVPLAHEVAGFFRPALFTLFGAAELSPKPGTAQCCDWPSAGARHGSRARGGLSVRRLAGRSRHHPTVPHRKRHPRVARDGDPVWQSRVESDRLLAVFSPIEARRRRCRRRSARPGFRRADRRVRRPLRAASCQRC